MKNNLHILTRNLEFVTVIIQLGVCLIMVDERKLESSLPCMYVLSYVD